jgi:hypothetical protein
MLATIHNQPRGPPKDSSRAAFRHDVIPGEQKGARQGLLRIDLRDPLHIAVE